MPSATPAAHGVSHEESYAAYQRHRPVLTAKVGCGAWDRARWIEHWLKVQAAPASNYAAICAEEALKNLGHK